MYIYNFMTYIAHYKCIEVNTMKYIPPKDQVELGENAVYKDTDLNIGEPGSMVPAKAIEAPQREIHNTILKSGIIPSDTDLTQLYQAIVKISKNNRFDTTYDTVWDMTQDTSLKNGMVVTTLGYYTKGDAGGATYLISNTDMNVDWAIHAGIDLYAIILNTDVVTYRMFGAKLNGIDDDGPAMRMCHNYAHTIYTLDYTKRIKQYTCSVENHDGIIYKKDTRSIDVYTNMDLSGSTLLIDDNNAAWFGIYVWGDVDSVYYSHEFTDEQKQQLTEGSYYFTMTDNSIPSNIVINLEETPYAARDDYGYMYTVGRKELLIHDMHGICASPLTSDWSIAGGRRINCNVTDIETGTISLQTYTSKFKTTFTHISAVHKTFTGCDVMINTSDDSYCSVVWVKQHNCTIKDFVFRPHRDSLRNSVFKNAMIYLWNSYNVTVRNINGFNAAGRNNSDIFQATSGYILRMSNCSDVTVEDCRLLGYWGATAMNSTKNIYFKNCQLNRVDSHDYVSNLYIDKCVLYNHGVQVGYGSGMLSITNCTLYNTVYENMPHKSNHILELNLTYGRVFSGKITIQNIKVVSSNPETFSIIKGLFFPNAVNISETFKLADMHVSNISLQLVDGSKLVYLAFQGTKDNWLSTMEPVHIKNIASDNTVTWEYVGRSVTWSANIQLQEGQLCKVLDNDIYKYYLCTISGSVGTIPPVATYGTVQLGSATCTALGTDIAWKSTHAYMIGDYIEIQTGTSFNSKVYKCITTGVSDGSKPTHTSDIAIDNDISWQYIGSVPATLKTWKSNTKYIVGDKVINNKLLFECISAGTSGSIALTDKAWFKIHTDGSVTWKHIGAMWEPSKWFDTGSYCYTDTSVYQVVGPYGSTSGVEPIECSGIGNYENYIWEYLSHTSNIHKWAANISLTIGDYVQSSAGVYEVIPGTTGDSNPQFTTGIGMDGTVPIQFIGLSSVWVKSTAYTVGQMVHSGGKIYVCTTAGTSADAGWGPTVDSGTTTDNTVVWQTITTTGVFRGSSVQYPNGQYIIVADARIYKVIPGTTGTIEPTDTLDVVIDGTVSLKLSISKWLAGTHYDVGDEVSTDTGIYRCRSNGLLTNPSKILFKDVDTNTDNVLFIDDTLPVSVYTKTDKRFNTVVRDCHGFDNDIIPTFNWLGTSQ